MNLRRKDKGTGVHIVPDKKTNPGVVIYINNDTGVIRDYSIMIPGLILSVNPVSFLNFSILFIWLEPYFGFFVIGDIIHLQFPIIERIARLCL